MERAVQDTLYSLVGINWILNEILEDVVAPLRELNYGTRRNPANSKNGSGIKRSSDDIISAPKFIMLTGAVGSGKSSVASVIVNELRRGVGRKSGDIFYKDNKVKFLFWDKSSWDTDLKDHLINIFQGVETYEGVTVLLFREFDSICPKPPRTGPDQHIRRAQRRRRQEQANFVQELSTQLDSIQVGKVLVIACSSHPEAIHKDVLDKVEFTYDLPYPDEEAREELLTSFLEAENAVLTTRSYTPAMFKESLVSATVDFSPRDIQYIVRASVQNAKGRFERAMGVACSGPINLEIKDFQRYIELDLHEIGEEREPPQARLDPRPHPGHPLEEGEEEDDDDDDDEDFEDMPPLEPLPANFGIPRVGAAGRGRGREIRVILNRVPMQPHPNPNEILEGLGGGFNPHGILDREHFNVFANFNPINQNNNHNNNNNRNNEDDGDVMNDEDVQLLN